MEFLLWCSGLTIKLLSVAFTAMAYVEDAALMQLGREPWPRIFHVPWVWLKKGVRKKDDDDYQALVLLILAYGLVNSPQMSCFYVQKYKGYSDSVHFFRFILL